MTAAASATSPADAFCEGPTLCHVASASLVNDRVWLRSTSASADTLRILIVLKGGPWTCWHVQSAHTGGRRDSSHRGAGVGDPPSVRPLLCLPPKTCSDRCSPPRRARSEHEGGWPPEVEHVRAAHRRSRPRPGVLADAVRLVTPGSGALTAAVGSSAWASIDPLSMI